MIHTVLRARGRENLRPKDTHFDPQESSSLRSSARLARAAPCRYSLPWLPIVGFVRAEWRAAAAGDPASLGSFRNFSSRGPGILTRLFLAGSRRTLHGRSLGAGNLRGDYGTSRRSRPLVMRRFRGNRRHLTDHHHNLPRRGRDKPARGNAPGTLVPPLYGRFQPVCDTGSSVVGRALTPLRL